VSWQVSIRAAADADIHQARDWYERQRPGLGDEFFLAVAAASVRLEEGRGQFPVYYLDFQRLITNRFPYKVFFRTEGDRVIVFRVLHARDHSAETF